jgi:ribosomal protein S18 acetylase RimI-like enzyme
MVETSSSVQFRAAQIQEDRLIAQHFYQLWRDNDVAEDCIRSDWEAVILQFMAEARSTLSYQAFVVEVAGRIVGSAGGQLFAGLYPLALTDRYRKYGYIWGVYVEPVFRGRGFAKTLTTMMIDHLKSLGCTRAILHASPSGKPVYTQLGFTDSNEMRLDL